MVHFLAPMDSFPSEIAIHHLDSETGLKAMFHLDGKFWSSTKLKRQEMRDQTTNSLQQGDLRIPYLENPNSN